MKKVVLVVLFLSALIVRAQKTDSLLAIFNNKSLHDTVRLKAIGDASWEQTFIKPDTAIAIANIELKYALHKNSVKWIIDANNNIGYAHFILGNFNTAIKYYTVCENLSKKNKLVRSSAVAAHNLGTVYYRMGNNLKAVKYFFVGLKGFEKLKDEAAMANSYNNIGTVYRDLKDYNRANNYYQLSLNLFKKFDNKRGISMIMNNFGLLNNNQKKYHEAIPFFQKSIAIRMVLKDKYGLSLSYMNLGAGYYWAGNIDSARIYYDSSYRYIKELDDPVGLALLSANYGELEMLKGNWRAAAKWCEKGLQLAIRNNSPLPEVKVNCSCLADAYAMGGNFKEAYQYHLKYIAARDTIDNKIRNEEISRKELEYSFEKKATADSVKNAEKEKVHKAEMLAQNAQAKQDKILRYSLFIGLGLVLLFAIFIFNRFKLTKKQNIIIHSQKEEVELKNKEITDSIHYAKRIQQALLPSEKYIKRNLGKK